MQPIKGKTCAWGGVGEEGEGGGGGGGEGVPRSLTRPLPVCICMYNVHCTVSLFLVSGREGLWAFTQLT